MYEISKDFEFSASHVLNGLPTGHKCARVHGHNYVVRLELRAEELDEFGFVIDYTELAPFKNWIDKNLDHQHLNDLFNGDEPMTAEWLAKALFIVADNMFDAVHRVGVSETPKTWAWYRP